ncbi:Fe-S cluster assembly protein SufD [Candidatus Uabimicrobium sp. HlEnr_7]|uniref:Fe-S cluster assembly protein SufD n=1 Tax=Candidatus Uabimicrobium helgolandensis TaxID=3095367 RepID=UPI00355786BE
MNTKQHFISLFEGIEQSDSPLQPVRKEAIETFSQLEFPTKRNEEWKYTNINPIVEKNYSSSPKSNVTQEKINEYLLEQTPTNVLVFVNGLFCEELSKIEKQEGIVICNLNTALEDHREKVTKFVKETTNNKEIFSVLNTALLQDGVFIHVSQNKVVENPIFILNISDSKEPFIHNGKNIIDVGENSQVSIVENYHHIQDGTYFNNITTNVFVAQNAHVYHTRLQMESREAYQVTALNIHQQKNSTYTSVNLDLGGGIIRNNINVDLQDSHIESNLYGLYLGKDKQLIDNHTFIDHAKPHCNSNELYKGILDDRARAVFNGKVLVRQDAQKTNAFQSNQNILLSENAGVDTKPQLEIFADDVKCSHGATVGELDSGAMFYLRARGIGEKEAHILLRQAFVAEVLQFVKQESLREKLEDIVMNHF